jgi:uncharacterized protein (TIGR03437 family)
LRSLIHSLVLAACGAIAALAQSATPAIDPNLGVENAANLNPNESLAAGSFVSIFGTNFATGLTLADTVPLSNSLANVSVTFNNVPAYIFGVAHNVTSNNDDRINAQLPWEMAGSATAQVVVTVNGVASAPAAVNLVPVDPGLMIFAQDSIGVLRPVAFNPSDNTLPYSSGAFPGGVLAVRPASISDPQGLVLVATGLGGVSNTPPDGSGAPQNGQVTTMSTPIVTVGGVAAQVTSSTLSTYPGQYQISILLGANTPTGDAIPVVIQDPASGLQSNPNLMIAVTN